MIARCTRAAAAGFLLLLLCGGGANAGLDLPIIPNTCSFETIRDDDAHVTIETPMGDIVLQLFPTTAPDTVINFERYIDEARYVDSVIHRVVPDFVIQGGGFKYSASTNVYERVETFDDILFNEPCISNIAGTVAMAKVAGNPNSATSQWFINLADNTDPEDIDEDPSTRGLDTDNGGFTVFGRVVEGLDIAIAIGELETLAEPVSPTDPTFMLADLPPFYATVQTPGFTFFRNSPVMNLPFVDSVAYGCYDSTQAGVLLTENPQSAGDWEPDVTRGFPFTIVSMACAGAGSGGTPSVPCSDPGRRVILMDSQTGVFTPDPAAEFLFAEGTLSCEDLAASEASFNARLTDVGAQLDSEFIRTAVGEVPEPSLQLLGSASLLVLAAIARRSRRSTR